MRVESQHPLKNGGWFHPFSASYKPPLPLRNPMKQPRSIEIDCGEMLSRWKSATSEDQISGLADELGVSARALSWLRMAHVRDLSELDEKWNGEAWAFPMYDATCPDGSSPCGIRLRTPDNRKFAVTGSKAGVFLPYGEFASGCPQRVFICEGPTDTAACLDMGLFAIGRASCRGQEEIVLSVLEQLNPFDCVLVSDNDGPGIEGARQLFKKIPIPKTMLVPPGKDMRAFVRDGGTKAVIDSMLKNLIRK